MSTRVRTSPKTAAERQRLERERNKRAKDAIIGLSAFAQNGAHCFLKPHEILSTVLCVTKWAIDGDDIVDEWRLTLAPLQRARTAQILEQAHIFLPFCTTCGADLRKDETGTLQRCGCEQKTAKSDAKGRALLRR